MVGDGKPEHPLHPRRPVNRRQLLLQVVVAAVILGSGIGIGAGGTILALKDRIITRVRVIPTDPPGREPNFIVAHWKEQYSLSEKQAAQAKDIVTKQFADLRRIRQTLFQAEQAAREKAAASLQKIFTSEQYAQWDQDMKRMSERFERWRAARGQRGDHKGPLRGNRGPGRMMDPNGRRGGWPPRFVDPNGHRIDGPPRPLDFQGHRGSRSSRGPVDPNGRHGPDRPPLPPAGLNNRPGDTNTPK